MDLANKNILMIGFGTIAQGLVPLLVSELNVDPIKILAIAADEEGRSVASEYGVELITDRPLTRENYKEVISQEVQKYFGKNEKIDLIINLSVDVSSTALISFAQDTGALYIDTCVEPWAGGYFEEDSNTSTNHFLREAALALRDSRVNGDVAPTAVIAHGANPGLVTHFVKEALLKVAKDRGVNTNQPIAKIANALKLRAVHISERDTQVTDRIRETGEFMNTWSAAGFVSELYQKAELGLGSHEPFSRKDGKISLYGQVCLNLKSAETVIESWVPSKGVQKAFLVTHHEALSIPEMLELQSLDNEYRPTVLYAYHPCQEAIDSINEFVENEYEMPSKLSVLRPKEITSGFDELGVLLIFEEGPSYWYGSQLSIEHAKKWSKHNTATTLQVTSAMIAAIMWIFDNKNKGVVEAEQMDITPYFGSIKKYLGHLTGVYTDWKPKDCMLRFSKNEEQEI